MTWAWFLVEDRGSSFRITQQTVTLGLLLLALGAVRAGDDFRTDGWYAAYLGALLVALALNVALYLTMEGRTGRAVSAVVP